MTNEEVAAELAAIAEAVLDLAARLGGDDAQPARAPGYGLAGHPLARRMPARPAVTLDTPNRGGYSLQRCLYGMLKKWRERDPGWPVDEGIGRQARSFGISEGELRALIAADPGLHAKFLSHPESGYR